MIKKNNKIKNGTHPYDKSVRPQILKKDFNKNYHSIIEEFRKLIDPIRKIIINNGHISGKNPGIEDCIFFGNLKWVDVCSTCNLLNNDDPVYKWYKNLLKITNKQIN